MNGTQLLWGLRFGSLKAGADMGVVGARCLLFVMNTCARMGGWKQAWAGEKVKLMPICQSVDQHGRTFWSKY